MFSEKNSQHYYDEFSKSYEDQRFQGYHTMIDNLEVDLAKRYCSGKVLEAGCGTGLILARLNNFCTQAVGIDLSAGMLAAARERGLQVVQAPIDTLPFPAGSFDTVVSFKVLAHIFDIKSAIAELVRVTRPGGYLVLEFYNKHSLRALIKRLKNPTRIGARFNDEDVYTRFDTLEEIKGYLPQQVRIIGIRGVRVLTPVAQVHNVPIVSDLFAEAERWAADTPFLRRLGGFMIVAMQKDWS